MSVSRRQRLIAQFGYARRFRLQCSSSAPALSHERCFATSSTPPPVEGKSAQSAKRGLAVASEARFNHIGVQHVSAHIHPQLFRHRKTQPSSELVALSKDHLMRHGLLGKNQDSAPPIAFDLPEMQGDTLDEHFHKLGMDSAEPYLSLAKRFAIASPPQRPRKWVRRSGWTKYNPDGTSEAIDAPNEDMLAFDTEVMWKETQYACMACAVSPTSWYAWISPWLLGESESDAHLIPLGTPDKARMVVGHNIGYDRARIKEEYNILQSKNFFMDTMSLHVAVNGMCSRQRPTWVKHNKSRELRDKIADEETSADLHALLESGAFRDEEEELWVGRSSINSLRDVAKFHCNIKIDKSQREYFGELDRAGVMERIDELLDYCAADVDITHRVYKRVLSHFLEVCPHPVSFAALRHLSAEILPIDKSWDAYVANAEATYHRLSDAVEKRLVDLANRAARERESPAVYQKDPWLSQLDWSGQEIKMVKGKKKDDPPRPAARQKMPGMPQWYKDLARTSKAPIVVTVRSRIAPILLRLCWDGHPLVWSDKHGWTYQVPRDEAFKYAASIAPADMTEEENLTLRDDRQHIYFKLPHKDGPQARCANPLAKGYLQYFEDGKLTSEFPYAKEALEMNASCSYWISARHRIMSQMVVYNSSVASSDTPVPKRKSSKKVDQGFIIPQVIPMGTITRRAVEKTWLTAANAKKNRVGSELKSMIRAPPGYCFVGADVDSEELWIASLVGDAQFKLHGGNAIGFMTLEGTKAAGTDLHSRTAQILGISRNDAKVFNYGRIYGAGQPFATTLLRQFNSNLQESKALEISAKLYGETKGKRTNRKVLRERPFWRGGTESFVFNKLEDFAEQEQPRTPVLGAGITEALMRRYITRGGFMPSRINWAIQSSGVDYLHLILVSMEYLIRRYALSARLALTVHDEIRYLVAEKDKYRAAMALQVANVWTRAMFSQQMGIDDLPQACAYFSAVDIDHVLRKEVDMDCVTPSNPKKIPPGESLDIQQLLEKGEDAFLDPKIVPLDPPEPERFEYQHRVPVMESMQLNQGLQYIKAQIVADDAELREIIKETKSQTQAVAASRTRKPRSRKQSVAPSNEAFLDSLVPVDEYQGQKFWKDWPVEQAKKYNNIANWDMAKSATRTASPRY